MPVRSAGLLLYRNTRHGLQVLLVHLGGPFWARKDAGAWSIPKGLVDPSEDELVAAKRELAEETGVHVEGFFQPLGEHRQPGGKIVIAWAIEADVDVSTIVSNTFQLEWPPKSGIMKSFPEVDRAEWFSVDAAGDKILKGQRPILDIFVERLGQ